VQLIQNSNPGLAAAGASAIKKFARTLKGNVILPGDRRAKKIARRARGPALRTTRPNEKWSMDFVAARLIDGRWFRVLTVVDQFTREVPAIRTLAALYGGHLLWGRIYLSQLSKFRGPFSGFRSSTPRDNRALQLIVPGDTLTRLVFSQSGKIWDKAELRAKGLCFSG